MGRRNSSATWLLLICATMVLGNCSKPSATGVYVAADTRNATMLQIVQDDVGRVTGQLTYIEIDANGETKDGNASVSGSANNGAIILQVQPISFLPFASAASGSTTGDRLTLNLGITNGKFTAIEFHRSDVGEFQRDADALRVQAQTDSARHRQEEQGHRVAEMNQQREKAIPALLVNADAIVTRAYKFSSNVERLLPDVRAAENECIAATQKLQERLDSLQRENSGPVSVRSSQFAASVNCNYRAVDIQRDFDAIQAELAPMLSRTVAACSVALSRKTEATWSNANPNWQSSCARIADATKHFSTDQKRMFDALQQAERTYVSEKERQQSIIAQATRLRLGSPAPTAP